MGDTRLAPGTLLGRYRLERLLGTGGMSSVWKARDERLGRPVAVKVLSETLALDASFVKRFAREAKVAAGLSHPNLVGVYDFSADGARPYLVSEYVEGGTLATKLERGDPVDAEALATELLGALGHIHDAGVIHRDVKPANVLVDRDGRFRLTDFGVAEPGGTRMTETGKVFGTLGYMAPEVRAGDDADERSDLYSAGVVLGEVLGDDGDPSLRRFASRLRADDPGMRPPSAAAALTMLGSTETEATTPLTAKTAVAPVPFSGPRRPSRGRRRVFRPALIAFVALLAGVALAQILSDGGGDSASGGVERLPAKTERLTTPAPAPVTVTDTRTVTAKPETAGPCGAFQISGGVPADPKTLEKLQKACEDAAKQAADGAPVPPGHQPGGPHGGD